MTKVIGSRGGNGIADKRCSVQLGNGSFCDARSTNDAPFPICERHLMQIIRFVFKAQNSVSPTVTDRESAERVRKQRANRDAASVVYYIDMGDGKIKIGRSARILERVKSFHRSPEDVLAVEIGGAKTESFRHRQFATERIERTEIFHASDALRQHVHELATAKNALTLAEAARQQLGRGVDMPRQLGVLANYI